jgi:hypothetical protein
MGDNPVVGVAARAVPERVLCGLVGVPSGSGDRPGDRRAGWVSMLGSAAWGRSPSSDTEGPAPV